MEERPGLIRDVVEQAKARLKIAEDAESEYRVQAQDDIKFAAGDQWDKQDALKRKLAGRAMLTINRTDTYCRNVENSMRQQRPRIKVHPVSDGAAKGEAKVIQGLIRHIEVASNADLAYDTGASYQVRGGRGYWRVASRYVDDDSFDQELYIDRVRNPFTVYFDPSSTTPDGSDAEWVLVVDTMRRSEFDKRYPGKRAVDFTAPDSGNQLSTQNEDDEIVLAEYWRVEMERQTLLQLSTGANVWQDDEKANPRDAKKVGELADDGVMVIDTRVSMRRTVKWSQLSGEDELQKRNWPGKYIPVVPAYGAELIDNGKTIHYGMVRMLKDPARMYNYMRTKEAEYVGLAVTAQWVGPVGFMEGHETEWETANRKNYVALEYNVVHDDQGQPLPPPSRIAPQEIPASSVHASMAAADDIKAVAGMFDPALGAEGNETSGTMVQRRQMQSDLSNFHFYDNLTRSIRHTGIVLLDLIPHYYNTQRTIRIIGDDGTPDSITINQKAIDKVLNDLTVGRYDVVMETGPGYDTKRQENVESMMTIYKTLPEPLVAGSIDLLIRQMDWPGADALADRFAMMNPLAQVDKQIPPDMDPDARKMLANALAQVQQLQKQVQQLSQEKEAKVFGIQQKGQIDMQLAQFKEDAETHRLHTKELGEDERLDKKLHVQTNDTLIKSHTDLLETRIDAETDIKIARMKPLERGESKPSH